jgi:hypothetical protein
MTRVTIPLSIAAALVLAACGSSPTTTTTSRAPTPATQTLPYHAGNGVVQSITVAPRPASAGASGAPVTTTRGEPVTSAGAASGTSAAPGTMHRLAIRMDDGRTQYVDMAGADIPAVGTRVQLTPDYKIIRQQ